MKTSQKPQNYYFLTSSFLLGVDRSWLRHRSFHKFSVQLKGPDFSNKKAIPVQTPQKQSVCCLSSVNYALEIKCIVFSCAEKCNRLVTIKIWEPQELVPLHLQVIFTLNCFLAIINIFPQKLKGTGIFSIRSYR
jgi:hypothetical protein